MIKSYASLIFLSEQEFQKALKYGLPKEIHGEYHLWVVTKEITTSDGRTITCLEDRKFRISAVAIDDTMHYGDNKVRAQEFVYLSSAHSSEFFGLFCKA